MHTAAATQHTPLKERSGQVRFWVWMRVAQACSVLTLQLGGSVLLLLLLREGLLQPADFLLVLCSRAPPVVQLGSDDAQVSLQGGYLLLILSGGRIHGMLQDKNLTFVLKSVSQSFPYRATFF